MDNAVKKLLMIFTGGTIACVKTEEGLEPLIDGKELLERLPPLMTQAELCIYQLCNIDSTDIGMEQWQGLGRVIEEKYQDYDGFVICHGTDTMAYTAAVLSYMVQGADKPIVITGSQLPIFSAGTDAVRNLTDSISYALDEDSAGVTVVFAGKAIAGVRAKKVKSHSFDAFDSINFPVLANINNGEIKRTELPDNCLPCHRTEFYNLLNDRVYILKLTPGMGDGLLGAIFEQYDGIIIESFGVGGIPSSIYDTFCGEYEKYRERGIFKLIVIATQVLYEGTDAERYEVGERLSGRVRYVEAKDMNIEAVYAKAAWILGHEHMNYERAAKLFYTPVGADIKALKKYSD